MSIDEDARIARLEEFVVNEPLTVAECLEYAEEESSHLRSFWLGMAKLQRAKEGDPPGRSI